MLPYIWVHVTHCCEMQALVRSREHRDDVQIQELVEAQRWAVQAFCRVDMSKLVSIVRDLHRDRQAHVIPSTPSEACCLLVWHLLDAANAGSLLHVTRLVHARGNTICGYARCTNARVLCMRRKSHPVIAAPEKLLWLACYGLPV